MEPLIYFNREFRPERDATVSGRSRALNYGLGCLAGIRGYKTDDGRQVHVFRLDRHVRRLEHSARILRLRLSGSAPEIADVIVELLRRNEMRSDVYIRPIVFANSNELSPLLDPETSETAIFCMPIGRYLSAEPIDVCVSSWCRVRENAIPARAKATAGYLSSALARREAMDDGYMEAILLTEDGHVSEGSGGPSTAPSRPRADNSLHRGLYGLSIGPSGSRCKPGDLGDGPGRLRIIVLGRSVKIVRV